jgi:hypothetical protein
MNGIQIIHFALKLEWLVQPLFFAFSERPWKAGLSLNLYSIVRPGKTAIFRSHIHVSSFFALRERNFFLFLSL